ncbi:MAG: cell division protein ZapA [Acidobacteriales bacterium]|nr:cell division protein ZapA [Terriglobales bacterium]
MATASKQSIKEPAEERERNNSVRVEIFDQPYSLRGSDPGYIQQLASYVDSKMRAVAEQTHTVDTARLAVLAAINIADEIHLLRSRQEQGSPEYSECAHRLASALDEALGHPPRT